MDIQTILKANFIRDLVQRTCGDKTEIIERPASYMIRNMVEGDRDIHRLIILPPHGFTADKINQTNSHDEGEYATIEIKGAVRDGKNSFSVLRDCLLIASIPQNGKTSDLNKPYMTFKIQGDENPDLLLQTHSAGTAPFAVLKSDGFGFYHNLINLTDDWLVMQLYKRLRPQRSVDLAPHMSGLLAGQADALQKFYDAVVQYGDAVYKEVPGLIENIARMPVQKALPALAEMLYTHDTGKHEACSVFALILKIGKIHPDIVKDFLQKAVEKDTIPKYYAHQLVQKIDKAFDQNQKVIAIKSVQ